FLRGAVGQGQADSLSERRETGVKLAHRRAVITGGSQGFGLAVARAFVQEGADVLLCARNAEQLRQAQEELVALAKGMVRVLTVPADVSQPSDAQRLVQTALAAFGGLEILVCNAGVYGPKGAVHDVNWADWSQAIAVNLLGTVLPCREVLPHFQNRQYG